MGDKGGAGSSVDQHSYGSLQGWQASVRLLELLQDDYQRARQQLEDICRTFSDREHVAREQLRSALEVATRSDSQRSGVLGTPQTLANEVLFAPLDKAPKPRKALTALATLQVRCLGSFEVSLGWDRLDSWRSNKAKLLLKYLIAQRRRPVPKDVLMETLWPECDPQAGNNNLKAAVHALRQTLNPNGKDANDPAGAFHVLFLEGSYMINPQVDLWVDVDEFERHCTVGRRLEKEGQTEEAMRAYELADSLYWGDYLQDDPYEEWALLRREALKDVYLSILGRLGEYSVGREDYEGGILYWQKVLSKDPCREDAYRGLIRCHSRLGQRSRALHWYNLCVRTIKTELNTQPDNQTEALCERLLQGENV